jgi:lantibiotic modifying enzyme
MSIYHKKIIDILNIISKTDNDVSEIGLFGGKMGLPLSLLTYALHSDKKKFNKEGLNIIEAVFKEIEHADSYVYSFSRGLAGVGWAFEYLEQKGFIKYNTNILLEDFDLAL